MPVNFKPYIWNPLNSSDPNRRIRFTHLLEIYFLDIYNADNSEFIIRLSHNSVYGNLWSDLKDNNGQRIPSGFYTYIMGSYFLENESLIEVTKGYFIINQPIE